MKYEVPVNLAAWGIACAFAAIMFWITTESGMGLLADSVDYVAAARQIALGHGAKTLDGEGGYHPLTQFPPGYPALLAVASRVAHRDVLIAGRWVHLVLYIGVVLLTAGLTQQFSGSLRCGTLAALLAASTLPLLSICSLMYSEAMFICCFLAGLIVIARGLKSPAPITLAIIAGLLIALAGLTRYAGAFLIVFGAVAWLMGGGDRSWRKRFAAAAIFTLTAALPVAAWGMRNMRVSSAAEPRQIRFHLRSAADLLEGLNNIGSLVIAPAWGVNGLRSVAVATLIVLVILFVMAMLRDRLAGRPLWILAAFALAYPLFLIVSSTFIDMNVRFNGRLLCPMYPILIALAVASTAIVVRGRPNGLLGALTVTAIIFGYGVDRTKIAADIASQRGQSYGGVEWIISPTMKAIAAAPLSMPIYTNAYDVVYLRTGRLVKQVPKYRIRSSATANPALDAEIDEMTNTLSRHGGWVAYFKSVDRNDFLITEHDLLQRLPLVPVKHPQPKDGEVFQLRKRIPSTTQQQ